MSKIRLKERVVYYDLKHFINKKRLYFNKYTLNSKHGIHLNNIKLITNQYNKRKLDVFYRMLELLKYSNQYSTFLTFNKAFLKVRV